MSAVRRWAQGVAAAVVLAAVVVGVPWLVVRLAGWPLPTEVPDWDRSWRMIRQGDVPAGTVIKTIAVVVWLAWLQLMWAVAWELAVNVPRTLAGVHHRDGPLIAEPVASGVGRLFAAIMAVGVLTASNGTAVARSPLPAGSVGPATGPVPSMVVETPAAASPARTAHRPAASHPTWVTNASDSLWSIAETALGDGTRVGDILALNPNLSTRHVPAGQPILLPDDAALPADRLPQPAPLDRDGEAAATPVGPVPTPTILVVEDGDTLWDLSEARLIAAGRTADPTAIAEHVQQIVDVNPDAIDDPDLIYTGQQLVMPNLDEPSALATTAISGDPAPAPTMERGEVAPVVHVIVPGDTLWDVLEAHHGHVDADLIWQVVADNALEDPSDIPVGTPVVIDRQPVAAPIPPPTLPQVEPAAAPVVVATTPPPPPIREPGREPSRAPPPTITASAAPPTASTAPSREAPTPTGTDSATPSPTSTGAVDAESDAELFEWAPRTLWWSIPGGLLLLAGLASMTHRLRARRLARLEPGKQLVSAPNVAAGTETAVSDGGPLTRLSTLQTVLRTLTPYAREQADPAAVRAVQLDADRVEVLFATPAPFPPDGWSTIDGGVSWVHRLGDTTAPTVQQLVTPALVTLGLRTDGGEILLDLETAGSLAIVGDRTAAHGLLRAMALELATYPLGVAMDVCLIGLDVDGTELCDRTWRDTTLVRAVRVARDVLARTAATGSPSLLAARAASDDDDGALDPHVFLVDTTSVASEADAALLDELVQLCTPQSGAALILLGDHAAARERIEIRSTTSATWSGADLQPVVVDREAVAQVAVMFDAAANAPAETLTPSAAVANHLAEGPLTSDDTVAHLDDGEVVGGGDADVARCRYVSPDHDVLIQVLGAVTVHGRPITAPGDLELLTLMAFKRVDRPNVDTIQSLLGRDNARKTLQTRISALRAKLAVGADGEDLLPSTHELNVPGRYVLSPLVLTDVDLIEHRYHTALQLASGDAVAVLRDGLELFRGPAFRGPRAGYNWAAPEGILARIANIINAYATLLMQLAFDDDDIALVLEAAGCAGRVLDDPVALLPMSEVQRHLAEASGDPQLTEAVLEANRRLRAHAEQYDPLVGT